MALDLLQHQEQAVGAGREVLSDYKVALRRVLVAGLDNLVFFHILGDRLTNVCGLQRLQRQHRFLTLYLVTLADRVVPDKHVIDIVDQLFRTINIDIGCPGFAAVGAQ